MTLREDIESEERARNVLACALCDVIDTLTSEAEREALVRAAAGTIGYRVLLKVLAKNGLVNLSTGAPLGETVIRRHRTEGHTP